MDLMGDDRLAHVLDASERLARATSVDEVVAILRDTAPVSYTHLTLPTKA